MSDAAGFLITFGGMVAFATVIGIYDLVAERQYRRNPQKKERQSA